ncbi:MAG: hypothetical protein A2X36_08200 [Elusimicrobia bacterium GWA2_69_24]|nr:MAG: hypothetical protein A2X36_08200 [Elusimicrobia bacterium GWA2_69_24]HBL16892.1 hypothetical protein [Elusimicrobiota bacterium]
MKNTDPKWIRYVILLTKGAKPFTKELLKAHIRHLRDLGAKGQLTQCGPFTDYPGGMLIVKAESLEEAKRIAASDPFVSSGCETCEVRTWELSCEENNHLGAG